MNKTPIDDFSGEPIPEWEMRANVMVILEKVKSGETTVPVARESLIAIIRADI